MTLGARKEFDADVADLLKEDLCFKVNWINPSGMHWVRKTTIIGDSYGTAGISSDTLKRAGQRKFKLESGNLVKVYS